MVLLLKLFNFRLLDIQLRFKLLIIASFFLDLFIAFVNELVEFDDLSVFVFDSLCIFLKVLLKLVTLSLKSFALFLELFTLAISGG